LSVRGYFDYNSLSIQDAAVGVEEGDLALLAEALAEKASVEVHTFDFFELQTSSMNLDLQFFETGCQLAPIRAARSGL
jgi:hypothetical protein